MKKIKKILFLCSVYKPNIGGVEITIENLTKCLYKKGINSAVFTKKFPFDLPENEFIDKSMVLRISRPQDDSEYLKSIDSIKKKLNGLKADIVHLIGVRRPMPLYGLLLSKLWRVPYIITFAGGDIPDPDEPESILVWQEGIDNTPQSILQADKLTAFSKYTAHLAKKTINKLQEIDIIYGGINLNEIKKTPKHKAKFKYFFTARRLDNSKGIDILIRAYHKVKKELPNIKLLVAGEGTEKKSLLHLIDKLELEHDVILLGALNHNEVISYMKAAIAHICPSRTESGGIVNYEAQAAGCIAIGSSTGGITEYIKNNKTGFIFPVGDTDRLARLLLISAKNKKETKKIKKTARIAISKKTWDIFSNTYLGAYKKLSKEYSYRPFTPWSDITKKMWEKLIT